ncbi:unnamed protein product [Eruca vesicaria subsp. sativa]|uniref:Knottins-like domain-containing protein n=1 Tax=Eruca vesicaria subsp. sativa TaxID=29727 RepID=A0ABC8LS46_ERUVS|nr:unnamed protein product [Eruca vesicaria subsp. sativa]
MAKFASNIALLLAALVLFVAFEAPTMMEAQKLCEKPSRTWSSGNCRDSRACKNQCINFEKARHGFCHVAFPVNKCLCYFPC